MMPVIGPPAMPMSMQAINPTARKVGSARPTGAVAVPRNSLVGDNRIDIVLDDGARSSLWWATRNEWMGLLDVSGLELEALYGGFAGEPFGDDSQEYVFVARR